MTPSYAVPNCGKIINHDKFLFRAIDIIVYRTVPTFREEYKIAKIPRLCSDIRIALNKTIFFQQQCNTMLACLIALNSIMVVQGFRVDSVIATNTKHFYAGM